MEMIKAANLTFEYVKHDEENAPKVTVNALEDVSLSIDKGEFVAILGHNGCGKSTLAKHFNALLLPTSGTVWVCEMDSSKDENAWYIRKECGMVFQNPDNQIIATIVCEDVAFGCENIGVPSAEIVERVAAALKTVNMSKHANDAPHFLSGGQKQRVAIAGILAMRPTCIILDEPTAMLDPVGRKEVMDTVKMLNRENGITVILITHYMDEAVQADRVIVMEQGHIVLQGTPKTVFSQAEALKNLGLDTPQVTDVCQNLIKLGVDIPNDILTIDEMVGAICQLMK